MKAPILSSLRVPPEVGRFYLVPAIQFIWWGVDALWPVLGPLHTDADFFDFDRPHYHVDARFVSQRLSRRVGATVGRSLDIFAKAQGYPLSRQNVTGAVDVPTGRPGLQRFKCQSAEFPYRFHGQEPVSKLRIAYGDFGPGQRALPIRKADGRLLCPHRKVDLSQIAPDAEGVVTCPLHGLRVCVERSS